MKNYSNIIFDLGGVILDIDYGAFSRAFQALGATDFDSKFSQYKQHPLFDAFEMGLVSPADFRPQLQDLFGTKMSNADFDHAWNSMLLTFPMERIALIQTLRKTKKVFVLSNTNLLHQIAYDEIFKKQTGLPNLAVLFDKAYYSHLIGMRKPNANIFEYVLNDNKINPADTLFIDDTSIHTDAAARLGINTIHLVKPTTIMELGLI